MTTGAFELVGFPDDKATLTSTSKIGTHNCNWAISRLISVKIDLQINLTLKILAQGDEARNLLRSRCLRRLS